MPWDIQKDGEKFCVHKKNADGSMGDRVDCHDDEESAKAQVRALYANEQYGMQVNEAFHTVDGRRLIEMTVLCEMRGQYPQLALPQDVDMAELNKQYQDDPVFVTLPIGQIDAQSRNGRIYRKSAVEQFVEQINERRPEGGWGHVSPFDFGTSYNPPAVRWLVAQMDEQGIAWGKALALTEETRQYFKVAKATRARTGTSLYAWLTATKDPNQQQGEDEIEEILDMDLLRLDLADPARVGVPMTAAQPDLSKEMRNKPPTRKPAQSEDKPMPENGTRIVELETEVKDCKREIADMEKTIRELRKIESDMTDLRELFHLDKVADVVKAMRSYQDEHNEMVAEAQALLTAAMTALIVEKVKIEWVRPIVTEAVLASKPKTRKELDRSIEEVLGRESVKTLLEKGVIAEMGPAHQRPADNKDKQGEEWQQYLDPKPEEA